MIFRTTDFSLCAHIMNLVKFSLSPAPFARASDSRASRRAMKFGIKSRNIPLFATMTTSFWLTWHMWLNNAAPGDERASRRFAWASPPARVCDAIIFYLYSLPACPRRSVSCLDSRAFERDAVACAPPLTPPSHPPPLRFMPPCGGIRAIRTKLPENGSARVENGECARTRTRHAPAYREETSSHHQDEDDDDDAFLLLLLLLLSRCPTLLV